MKLEKRILQLEKVDDSTRPDLHELTERIKHALLDRPEELQAVSGYLLAGNVREACAIVQPYLDRLDEKH